MFDPSPTGLRNRVSHDPFILEEKSPLILKISQNFYSNRIVNLWNSLPLEIRSITPSSTSTRLFKTALANYYTHMYKLHRDFNVEDTCIWLSHCRCASCGPNAYINVLLRYSISKRATTCLQVGTMRT